MEKLRYITLLFFAISLQNCIKPVDDLAFPQAEVKLVVSSEFTPKNNFHVFVSKSKAFKNGDQSIHIDYVDNATVSIYTKGRLLEILHYNAENEIPCYTSRHLKGETGVPYEIKVEAPGFQTIRSENKIPFPSNIAGTTLPNNDVKNLWVSVSIKDEQLANPNYFLLNFFELNKLSPTNITRSHPLKIFASAGQPLDFFPESRGVLLTDKYFKNGFRVFTFKVALENPSGDSKKRAIILELKTITKDYYDYYQTLIRQSNDANNQFSNPSVSSSNIENGYGIFAGSSITTDTVFINK